MTGCQSPHFFKVQASILRRCVDEHKWYLSERAQRDVGWDAAMDSFCEKYFQGFAAGFRAAYCGLFCPNGKNCGMGYKYAEAAIPLAGLVVSVEVPPAQSHVSQ